MDDWVSNVFIANSVPVVRKGSARGIVVAYLQIVIAKRSVVNQISKGINEKCIYSTRMAILCHHTHVQYRHAIGMGEGLHAGGIYKTICVEFTQAFLYRRLPKSLVEG